MGLFGKIGKTFSKGFKAAKTIGSNGVGFVSDVARGKNIAKSAYNRTKGSVNAVAAAATQGFKVVEHSGDSLDKAGNYALKQGGKGVDLGFRGAESAVNAFGSMSNILASPQMLMMGGAMVLVILVLK